MLSQLLRATVLGAPVLAALGASLGFETVVVRPSGVAQLWWWLASLVVGGIGAALVQRSTRRLLPLTALLRISLAFPDVAPSRFKIARSAGNPARIAQLASATSDARSAAAAQVLAVLVRLKHHDRLTRGHSERVRVFTDLLADQMEITGLDRDKLSWGGLLHDIGKMSVPGDILNKKGRPTPEEWDILQGHPAAGPAFAEPLMEWLGEWSKAITEHHERWDGGGYPSGLRMEEISQAGRIVAVADAYETMTAVRSYKKPLSVEAARVELTRCAGGQFDPAVVRSFLLVGVPRSRRSLALFSWLLHLPFTVGLQNAASGVTGGLGAIAGPAGALSIGGFTAAALTFTGAAPVAAAALHQPATTKGQTSHPSTSGRSGHARLSVGPSGLPNPRGSGQFRPTPTVESTGQRLSLRPTAVATHAVRIPRSKVSGSPASTAGPSDARPAPGLGPAGPPQKPPSPPQAKHPAPTGSAARGGPQATPAAPPTVAAGAGPPAAPAPASGKPAPVTPAPAGAPGGAAPSAAPGKGKRGRASPTGTPGDGKPPTSPGKGKHGGPKD